MRETRKKIIEQYIQFAIDNGYNKTKDIYIAKIDDKEQVFFVYGNIVRYESDGFVRNLYKLITSRRFIEAIVSGINYKGFKNGNPVYGVTLDDITKFQAIAIRDGKLEEFITNLLGLGKK